MVLEVRFQKLHPISGCRGILQDQDSEQGEQYRAHDDPFQARHENLPRRLR